MKSAVLCIDPNATSESSTQRLLQFVKTFQDRGLLENLFVTTLLHPHAHAFPHEWYRKHKKEIMEDLHRDVKKTCEKSGVKVKEIHVLDSISSISDDYAFHLSKFASQKKADLLIVGNNNRKGLPYWFLGSFSETLALTATLPVLVVKPLGNALKLSKKPTFVFCVDVYAPPSSKELTRVVDLAKTCGAQLELIYIEPQQSAWLKPFMPKKPLKDASKELAKLCQRIKTRGVDVKSKVLFEKDHESMAHAVSDYAEKKMAWLTVVSSPSISKARRPALGSASRKILSLSKRSVLSFR